MPNTANILPGRPVKLTKNNIDAIKTPGIYPDTELKGYRLRVAENGLKSYQLVGKVKGSGQTVFCTIGRHGDPWTPDKARAEAGRLRLLLKQGTNPNDQREQAKRELAERKAAEAAKQAVNDLTVGAAFEEFLTTKKQKESTVTVYRYVFGKHFEEWLDRPLVSITQDDVLNRYDKIAAESKSSAAHAMRIFRAVFHTAQIKHSEQIPELVKLNPVKLLTHASKGWNKVEARETYIHDDDLPAWFMGVSSLSNTTARDYLMVCILTGMRKSEVCRLQWDENIDLTKKVITLTETKSGKRHSLAMSDYLYELFQRRWNERDSKWVFSGKSKAGHFSDPEKPIKEALEVAEISTFASHDLRRTFATAADGLGYDVDRIQRFLNQAPKTIAERHYIQRVVERTRLPMQRINDYLLEMMGAKEPAEETTSESRVVPFAKSK